MPRDESFDADEAITDALAVVEDQFAATRESKELRAKLDDLVRCVGNVVYHWQRFDEPGHETRKQLYESFIKAGGKTKL